VIIEDLNDTIALAISVGALLGIVSIFLGHELRNLWGKPCGFCEAPYNWRKK